MWTPRLLPHPKNKTSQIRNPKTERTTIRKKIRMLPQVSNYLLLYRKSYQIENTSDAIVLFVAFVVYIVLGSFVIAAYEPQMDFFMVSFWFTAIINVQEILGDIFQFCHFDNYRLGRFGATTRTIYCGDFTVCGCWTCPHNNCDR